MNLGLPTAISATELFDEDPSVIVQFRSTNPSACWTSAFEPTGTKKNLATEFKAGAP